MLLSNEIYFHQIKNATESLGNSIEKLKKQNILVTGSSGMLGSCIIDIFLYLNEQHRTGIEIYAAGRHKEKIKKRFGKYTGKSYFHIMEFDVSIKQKSNLSMDYIIHAASNADPATFVEFPVETFLVNILGVKNMLDLALISNSKRILYVSSGEMYGQPNNRMKLEGFSEDYSGYVNYQDVRSCYPSGKRAGEILCQSYIYQHGADAVIARPCHCYGPTMTETDSRALSQFFRKALNGEDIVLKSSGKVVRSHCYVIDAATGILKILLDGVCGEAYNIAEPDSVVSIRKAAELIADAGETKVCFETSTEKEQQGYSKVSTAVLNPEKLLALGWHPQTNMQTGVFDTIKILNQRNI